eukprot:CAMPEP_0119125552 /NCGR_PEP_ID=MMETSP1310-20130426/4788_1 /TAXON_ID=464262 /ORGANISM="Genus nov. species nov., Strain RCC2339" /LENGTH=180 /DNA_ID=CAMNT_0007115629 /DNA_START=21 /DNA_END=563 /DNA_ORIENTATION=-
MGLAAERSEDAVEGAPLCTARYAQPHQGGQRGGHVELGCREEGWAVGRPGQVLAGGQEQKERIRLPCGGAAVVALLRHAVVAEHDEPGVLFVILVQPGADQAGHIVHLRQLGSHAPVARAAQMPDVVQSKVVQHQHVPLVILWAENAIQVARHIPVHFYRIRHEEACRPVRLLKGTGKQL